jgi:hypothetical protein
MPYNPYWFESFAPCLPWIVPAIALIGLWVAKATDDCFVQRIAERIYFAAMLLVAAVTLRTVVENDGCWLLHMVSMGIMALGATSSQANYPSSEVESDVESDVAMSEI